MQRSRRPTGAPEGAGPELIWARKTRAGQQALQGGGGQTGAGLEHCKHCMARPVGLLCVTTLAARHVLWRPCRSASPGSPCRAAPRSARTAATAGATATTTRGCASAPQVGAGACSPWEVPRGWCVAWLAAHAATPTQAEATCKQGPRVHARFRTTCMFLFLAERKRAWGGDWLGLAF